MKKILYKKFHPRILYFIAGIFLIIGIAVSFYIWKNLDNWFKFEPINTNIRHSQTIKYKDFHLEIPKLGIDAPVIKNVEGYNQTQYFKALEKGIAHFKGTALPGEKNNCFIFGHSSYYYGKYKEIFKNLHRLKKEDEFSLWYESKEYKYHVSISKEIAKDNVSVLEQTGKEKVTLMTCYPPGTTRARWVIVGLPIKN